MPACVKGQAQQSGIYLTQPNRVVGVSAVFTVKGGWFEKTDGIAF